MVPSDSAFPPPALASHIGGPLMAVGSEVAVASASKINQQASAKGKQVMLCGGPAIDDLAPNDM